MKTGGGRCTMEDALMMEDTLFLIKVKTVASVYMETLLIPLVSIY